MPLKFKGGYVKKEILICDKYTQDSLSLLSSSLDCNVTRSNSRQPSVEEVSNTNALLIRSRTTIDEALLSRSPNLELIISATSGFDHIDFEACKNRNITIMHTPQANIEGAAQLTIMHILDWMRNSYMGHKAVVSHTWKEELPIGSELGEKHVGILGLGRVGKRVATLCKAFNAKVSAHDPFITESEFKEAEVQALGFTELLRECDILSLHLPLTDATRGVMNSKTFEIVNDNALLINTARGSLINEQDLFEALQNKQLAGAALDVFNKEPLPRDSNLRHLSNVTFSPHIGAYTREAFSKASTDAAKKTIAFFKANEISDELPPKKDWVK